MCWGSDSGKQQQITRSVVIKINYEKKKPIPCQVVKPNRLFFGRPVSFLGLLVVVLRQMGYLVSMHSM